MPKMRIPIVMAFFLVGLAVIFGGQHIVHGVVVDKPLESTLASIQGVNSFAFDDRDGKVALTVDLGRVANLEETYELIEKAATKRLGPKLGTIEVQGAGNERLDDLWYDIHYIVREAASTGAFSKMRRMVDRAAAKSGLAVRLWVGDTHIFVQMADRGKSIYKVVPRSDAQVVS